MFLKARVKELRYIDHKKINYDTYKNCLKSSLFNFLENTEIV